MHLSWLCLESSRWFETASGSVLNSVQTLPVSSAAGGKSGTCPLHISSVYGWDVKKNSAKSLSAHILYERHSVEAGGHHLVSELMFLEVWAFGDFLFVCFLFCCGKCLQCQVNLTTNVWTTWGVLPTTPTKSNISSLQIFLWFILCFPAQIYPYCQRRAHSEANDHVGKVLVSMELGMNFLRWNIALRFMDGKMI